MKVANLALKNADSLIQDGDLLFNNARYPRSAAIYQLAIEEVGKALLANGFLIFDHKEYDKKIEEFNKCFFHHVPKSEKSVGMDFLVAQMIFKDEPQKMVDFILNKKGIFLNKTFKEMDDMRNNCFYIGLINNRFVDPASYMSEESAAVIQKIAKVRYNSAKAIIDIAIKHLTEIRDSLEKNPIDGDLEAEKFAKKYFP